MVATSTDSSPGSPGSLERGTRYFVLKPLASGGMATVELALQVSAGGFERLVALKRVRPHLVSSEEIEAMFLEEARIAARLNHPNLIHAYEVGHDATGGFLAMEYLSGQSYSQLVERAGLAEIDLRVVLETLIATLDGLECVHGLRDIGGRHMALVHRDISPSNLFVTYSGQVKVLDFGIAKARLSSIQTQVGVLKGKVVYMAPEQAAGGSIDARADLYAVGVMLWEAIAGRRRWSETPEAVVLSHLLSGTPPLSPLAVERGLPPLADAICLKALAPDPAERFQTAAELRLALEELASALGPRLSGRALGDYVVDCFAVERAHVEHQIEQSLSELDRDAASPRPRSVPPARDTRSIHKTRELQLAAPRSTGTPAPAVALESSVDSALSGSGRQRARWALATLGALGAVALAAWLGMSSGASEPPTAVVVEGSAPVGHAATETATPSAPVARPVPARELSATLSLSDLPVESPAPAPAAQATPPSAKPARAAAARPTAPRANPNKTPAAKASGLALDRRSPW